jgi:hypothetical protein
VDVNHGYVYKEAMAPRTVKSRIFALLAAYAIALQSLLSAIAMTAHAAAGPAAASLAICAGPTDGDLPARPDQPSCAAQCLMACATSALPPPERAVVAAVAPLAMQIVPRRSIATWGRAARQAPHNPRAPPIV